MNYGLSKEIYGVPWSVDALSFKHLSSILKDIRNGVKIEIPETKLNSISLLEIKGETRVIKSSYDLKSNDSFDGIGIINLNGPITRNGGDSSFGTKQLSESMISMSQDSRIKGFIIMTDSGGGATGAVQLMQDAINQVKEKKPVYSLIEKGGMAGSAAYGIISATNKIYSEDGMNIVGSAGTMISFSGAPNGTTDANGEKQITLYATKSVSKNKGFNEAIENDNYEVIINELLDPVNENFLSSIENNRPILKGTNYDDGRTVFSKDAIGTFIDGIASFDEVVQMVLTDSQKQQKTSLINNNQNSSKMTKEELKNSFPDVHSSILLDGVAKEKERVASWMVYQEADSEAVRAGIDSGNDISPSQREQLMVKMNAKTMLSNLSADAQKPIQVAETPVVVAEENETGNEVDEIAKSYASLLTK